MNDLSYGHCQFEELRSSKAMLRAMLDGTRTFVVLLDTQGLVVDATSVAVASIGASIEQVIDVPFENTEWCNHGTGQDERLRDAINRAANGERVQIDLAQCTVGGDLRILDFAI